MQQLHLRCNNLSHSGICAMCVILDSFYATEVAREYINKPRPIIVNATPAIPKGEIVSLKTKMPAMLPSTTVPPYIVGSINDTFSARANKLIKIIEKIAIDTPASRE
jgi:hypothetical protein